MPETATPPAPAAPAAPAAAPAQPSPKSAVPPVGTSASMLAAAKQVFAPDPSKAAPAGEPPAKPVDTPAAKPADAAAPEVPSIIKKDVATAAKPEPALQEFPEDKLPEPATDAAKAGWKELKAITKTERNRAAAAEQRIKELEAKQAAAPATSTDTAELEKLKAENKAYSDRLLTLDLRNHPDFHRQYTAPKKQALDTAKEVIAYNGKEAPQIEALLGKPLKDFNAGVSELTKDMNPADAATVMQSLRQARDITGQEQAALSKAGEVHQQLTARTQQAQKQAFESVASEVLPNFERRNITPEMKPEDKAAAEAYNQSVDAVRANAERLAFGKVSEKEVATMAFKAAAMDHLTKHAVPFLEGHIKSQNQVIADLTAQLKSLQGGKAPSPSGGAAPASAAAPANETIEQAARRTWGKA